MTAAASTRRTPISVPSRIGSSRCTGANRRNFEECEGEGDTTLFLVGDSRAAVVCTKRLRARWLEEQRRERVGLESLPDFDNRSCLEYRRRHNKRSTKKSGKKQ